jgi:hypothetical protein
MPIAFGADHVAKKRSDRAGKRRVADMLVEAFAQRFRGLITRNPKQFYERVLSTIAFGSACSCAGTPNLSSMPQLLSFDIEANELGVYPMSTTLFDLSGRTALVTGGSKGLGKAMARALA